MSDYLEASRRVGLALLVVTVDCFCFQRPRYLADPEDYGFPSKEARKDDYMRLGG